MTDNQLQAIEELKIIWQVFTKAQIITGMSNAKFRILADLYRELNGIELQQHCSGCIVDALVNCFNRYNEYVQLGLLKSKAVEVKEAEPLPPVIKSAPKRSKRKRR